MVRKLSIILHFLAFTSVVFGQSSWLRKADFLNPFGAMWGCGFSIGTKGYVVGGGVVPMACGCFYEYNPTLDVWTQKANAPYPAGIGPAVFAIGSKGYICGGNQGPMNYLFYEYDTLTNIWTRKADLPIEIEATVGFSIGTKGYVVTGQGNPNIVADVWEFNPTFNNWTQKASFPGGIRAQGVGFAIGNKGYFGTGYSSIFPYGANDFWEFNPAANAWLQKANLPGNPRHLASGFSVNGKGYIGLGHDSIAGPAGKLNDFWEYDTLTDSWTPIADFETPREYAVGFSIKNKGYVLGGMDSTSTNFQALMDFWEYPDTTLSIPVLASEKFYIYPNPNQGSFTLKMSKAYDSEKSITVFDMVGNNIFQSQKNFNVETAIDISQHSRGIFFVKVTEGDKISIKKIVIQ